LRTLQRERKPRRRSITRDQGHPDRLHGQPFTEVSYKATLTTAHAVSCSVLSEAASGSAKFKRTPKAKARIGDGAAEPRAQRRALRRVLRRNHGWLVLAADAHRCRERDLRRRREMRVAEGEKKVKAVKKGTFTGTTVAFE
jgi:hypothetical protein